MNSTYFNELLNFELNFYIFGYFLDLIFTIFLLSSKKQSTVLVFLIFYILIPLNMAVDYTRYGTLLIIVILFSCTMIIFYIKNIKIIALIVVILNIVTPKYYMWDDQITYLRDSLHF